MNQKFFPSNSKLDKVMTPEQFSQIVEAILLGKYSWACVLILRFAGYNPLHYIPYRTYNRLMKEHCESGKLTRNHKHHSDRNKESSAAIYNNLGYTLQQQGKWKDAIACYQKALALEPECIEAEVNWANMLYALGKLSSETQAHYAAMNNDFANKRKQAGDLKTAIAYYRQAISMKPDLADAYDNLRLALQEQGEYSSLPMPIN